MTDLTELRRLAEAALEPHDNAAAWHAFHDEATPQTVLDLLDALDRYRAALVAIRDLHPSADDGTAAHALISIARNALEAK